MSKSPTNESPLCASCGYDLTGLSFRARCPECGLPNASTPRRVDDPLSMMPLGMIRALRRACFLASACVAGAFLTVVFAPRLADKTEAVLFAVITVAWVVAVWRLTPGLNARPAAARGFSNTSKRRRAARWLQAGWVVAAAAHLFHVMAPAKVVTAGVLPQAFQGTVAAGIILGIGGFAFLAILLEGLADWTYDREAKAAFNVTVWGVVVSIPLLIVMVPSLKPFVMIGVFTIIMAAASYALLSLTKSIAWSVAHAREHQERLRRRQDRADEDQEARRRSVAAMDRPTEN